MDHSGREWPDGEQGHDLEAYAAMKEQGDYVSREGPSDWD